MFFFKKPEEKFEFLFVKGIMLDEISSTLDFINFIDSENARLESLGQTGSMVAIKYLEKRNKKKMIYAQRIHLPVASEVDMDEFLNNFYSMKPIAFDESILTIPPVTEESETTQKEILEATKEDSVSLSSKEAITSIDLSKVIEKNVYSPHDAMQKEIERQRAEIEELKQLLLKQQSETVVEDSTSRKVEVQVAEESETTQKKVLDEATKEDSVSLSSKEPSTAIDLSNEMMMDTDVEEVLDLVKSSYQEKVQNYLEEERQKILVEIKELDQRDKIEAQVSEKLNKQKNIDLKVMQKELAADFEKQMEEENRRHQEALKQLELTHKKTQAAKEVEIEEAYRDKITQTIQKEYETQTIQLERILQGKAEELQLRQKEMNKGLKADFEKILQTFNQGHESVIQLVEAQKKEKNILSFPEKVRKKA
ncbi:hypothetical protein [Enterococcus cecorum]|uniref:Uncharacterized protein n=1 Tax=Enterococcus cecorum DSM 20682 = ATCC 43198 TaxID=1121864 RepID=S1R1P3_9ENTE|nr:hypothetical protein [Enterococcus cecorum]EOX19213.1 hypothetical protein I567_00968 [Enterococcus cecorum DSM 20682 = ATCC 43198]ESK62127.1 hypothetical protein OMO_01115 [Enterococcus cecorum DSM 20682 = ATCC 43198]OJG34144.1 hypothetical protein RT42_GL001227 [Enterococcus cecorum DSM 20682 = ATCC 43198]CAI3335554.1 hypothetical protein CIRMBP1318_00332 [Enterococcus cecorum DSM 20682 = ATCC 43198]SQE56347.1 Uncharacterised protein [Enterococcus cecorum]